MNINNTFTDFDFINKEKLVKFLKSTNGKFFTVCFIKRSNGEKRVMNCRLGVKKYLKGGQLAFDALEKDLLPVFDIQKKQYRMINLETIKWIKFEEATYINLS